MKVVIGTKGDAAGMCILPAFEDGSVDGPSGWWSETAQRLAASERWEGKAGQVTQASGEKGEVVVWGLGGREEFSPEKLRRWLDKALVRAGSARVAEVTLVLPGIPAADASAAVGTLARLQQSDYRFDEFRSESKKTALESISVVPPGNEEEWRAALDVAAGISSGARWTRDLANSPPNVATPAWMAEQAVSLKDLGFEVEVLGPDELAERKMGGILAVGAGSRNTPRLVRLHRRGDGPTVALVGKGVTFDTGGISLKPGAGMDEMKYDKGGACTVLGIARAAGELDLPIDLKVYVPLAENMPDGQAYRPGDILRCYNGKTVEVLNTDAEGRLILADALSWAVEDGADRVVEFSTLTGAIVVALGAAGAGFFTPDDTLAGGLLGASERVGEKLWRMPLWPEFREAMKGTHADLKNVAGRWGGACTAAAFLSNFVGDHESWAHVDIAGTAWIGADGKGPKGATGYGVGLAIDWMRALE